MMLVLQDFCSVIVHRSFYTQPTIIGFHNHWNNPWLSHNMRFHKFLVQHFIIILFVFFLNWYIIAKKKSMQVLISAANAVGLFIRPD